MPDSRGDAHVHHPVVTHEAWLAARRQLMEEEKAWTRQGEEISRLQHALPWEVVAKDYRFDGPSGASASATSLTGGVNS